MSLNNIKDTNEPIDDTLSDIIGYALLWKMLRSNTFDLPLVQEDPNFIENFTEYFKSYNQKPPDFAWQKSDAKIKITIGKGDMINGD